MNERTDGWTDGWKDVWKDGYRQKERQIDGQRKPNNLNVNINFLAPNLYKRQAFRQTDRQTVKPKKPPSQLNNQRWWKKASDMKVNLRQSVKTFSSSSLTLPQNKLERLLTVPVLANRVSFEWSTIRVDSFLAYKY